MVSNPTSARKMRKYNNNTAIEAYFLSFVTNFCFKAYSLKNVFKVDEKKYILQEVK